MRVLHTLDELHRGGAEMLALDVCRNARANNLELTFVATGGGKLEDDFRSSEVDFIRLRRTQPIDLHVVARLRRIVREREIQIVHSHQAVEAAHVYLATLGTNVKRVLSFHGCVADSKNRLAWKFLVPRMDANVAVSRGFLARLREENHFAVGDNFHVLLNGVDARRLGAPNPKRLLRDELNLKSDDLLFGMVGNFYPGARKDQMTVCKALPALFDRISNVHFAFVGGRARSAPHLYDECVEHCRAQGILDRVHFLGNRADIADVLSSLDLFVFSSIGDTFGIAVVEAMMMGVPTIVSDIEPLLEVSNKGRYAELFRAGDAEDLAEKLIASAQDESRRERLAAGARDWAHQQFGIEAYIARLKELYRRLIWDGTAARQA